MQRLFDDLFCLYLQLFDFAVFVFFGHLLRFLLELLGHFGFTILNLLLDALLGGGFLPLILDFV